MINWYYKLITTKVSLLIKNGCLIVNNKVFTTWRRYNPKRDTILYETTNERMFLVYENKQLKIYKESYKDDKYR